MMLPTLDTALYIRDIVYSSQIEAVNVYACTVIGYLVYSLAQVFLFCFFGNRLIEEVMCTFTISLNVPIAC
jgi:gustatory receptor